jgi:hypothetical protein
MDSHVETYPVPFTDGLLHRGYVFDNRTGRQRYVTWPYRRERAARARAKRWIDEEREKMNRSVGTLFGDG